VQDGTSLLKENGIILTSLVLSSALSLCSRFVPFAVYIRTPPEQEAQKGGGAGKGTAGEADIVFRAALSNKICACERRKDCKAITRSFNWKCYCCQINTHRHPLCLPMNARRNEMFLSRRFM